MPSNKPGPGESANEAVLRAGASVPYVIAGDAGRALDRTFHLAALVLALLWLLFWYRGTVDSLVEIWGRSDTYAHGFLVAPISFWLVWRIREPLRRLPLRPSLLGVLAGLVAGFAWLLGELASVASVSQFALVGMFVSLVWAVMGTAIARALAFPLGFLFFAVPFGEFLFPTMMDRTADFVIWGLRLSGVPVYAEGRNLVIPSGQWSVVEGCSGVRYLIASVVVGALYAYLNYRSLPRRLLFVAASLVVPVLANWLRAYGIVMLGHLSGNRLAAGVDHLVYGWVFFGIVMLALFWFGARWREDDAFAPQDATAGAAVRASPRTVGLWLLLALAAVLGWKPVYSLLDAQGQHGPVRFAELPARGAWQPQAMDRLPAWSPRYAGMRGELRAAWAEGERPLGLFIAYYRDQGPGEELINSENRILINKDPVWSMTAYGEREAALGAQSVKVRSTDISDRQERLLVWRWYWIGGRWTSSDYLAKFYLAISRLAGRGDDSAAIIIYTPFAVGEREAAERTLGTFVREMGPSVGEMLAQAMAR